jgi:hypothetical protein
MSYSVGSTCNASWDASLMRRITHPLLKYGPMASGQAPYASTLTKQFWANLDGHPKVRCGSLVDLAWLIMARITSCIKFSNFPKVKLVRDFNGLDAVLKMSHTPTLGLSNCPLSSSNTVDVKYSQVLTQVNATCTAICSSTAIFLNQRLIATQVKIW